MRHGAQVHGRSEPRQGGDRPGRRLLPAGDGGCLSEGDTVFDVLQRVCRAQGIHMESNWTPAYNSAHIEGIGNLYEFDCGNLSGWMYSVNGVWPDYGCSSCTLQRRRHRRLELYFRILEARRRRPARRTMTDSFFRRCIRRADLFAILRGAAARRCSCCTRCFWR